MDWKTHERLGVYPTKKSVVARGICTGRATDLISRARVESSRVSNGWHDVRDFAESLAMASQLSLCAPRRRYCYCNQMNMGGE